MKNNKSTITDLPADILAAIPEAESIPKLATIIKEAKAGEFHDYQNNKYATPKWALVEMLDNVMDDRLEQIRTAVTKGYYDE
jgi:hypothetical protein